MKSEIEIDDALIARYLGGEATPEEAMALDSWLQNPVNQLHFNELKRAWDVSYPAKASRSIDTEKAWRVLESRQKEIQKGEPKQVPLFKKALFKVAASIVLITSFSLILFYSFRNDKVANVTIESKDSLHTITFPDNSMATLNRNSAIVYAESFEKKREVHLNRGEAFFKVIPDVKKPFTIHTEAASIQVLGTSFNVVIEKEAIDVSVEEGKVLVYNTTDTVLLGAGMAAAFRNGNLSFTKNRSNSNTWAYATHKFVFNNAPLREVFDYIEKAQDCSIQLADENIGNCKLSATFESVSTDYMLNLITEALNLSVTSNDDRTFTVEGEGCH